MLLDLVTRPLSRHLTQNLCQLPFIWSQVELTASIKRILETNSNWIGNLESIQHVARSRDKVVFTRGYVCTRGGGSPSESDEAIIVL